MKSLSALNRLARQSGQSTTEFVVLALVLVPLFIAVPLLGKYIDIMQTAEEASRYIAFEGASRNSSSAWKADADLAIEVRRRFFSNSNAPVKTDDVAGNFTANRNPIWSDHTGAPLLDNFERTITVQTEVADKNAIAATWPYRGELGLTNSNLYTAMVTVKPADINPIAQFDSIVLSTTRKTVLLTDAWTAKNTATIRSKIEDSLLIYPIGKVREIVDVIGLLPTVIFDPALKVGNFDWDIVPCDRLIGGC